MPSGVAFLPWVAIDEPLTIGPLRLLPYHRGKLPGDLTNVTQKDIDGVLKAYANRPRNRIREATILEFGEWRTGMDVEDVLPDLFRARNALAFSALSQRQLFRQHHGYCNYDTYTLIVQRFVAGNPGTFAFTTRRRDGGTNQLWASDEFAFHRPNHVDTYVKFSVDQSLLAALLTRLESNPSLLEAVVEFNCANTDSSDVPGHVEVVMIKSAFEWLLEIGEQVGEFVNALSKLLQDVSAAGELDGPLRVQWERSRPKAVRPLEAWAREFCDTRGASAHGKPRVAPRFVWTVQAHLAFASMLFPLVFKKVAAAMGLLKLDDYDVERLRRIDAYLLHDPFTFDWTSKNSKHPWLEIDSEALVHARSRRFYGNA